MRRARACALALLAALAHPSAAAAQNGVACEPPSPLSIGDATAREYVEQARTANIGVRPAPP